MRVLSIFVLGIALFVFSMTKEGWIQGAAFITEEIVKRNPVLFGIISVVFRNCQDTIPGVSALQELLQKFIPVKTRHFLDKREGAGGKYDVIPPTLGNLGEMKRRAEELSHKGYYEASYYEYQRIVKISVSNFGEDHQDTLGYEAKMADALQKYGNVPEANKILVKVLNSQKRSLGQDHPDTLRTEYFLAKNLEKQGKYQDAFFSLKRVYKSQTRTLGIYDNETLATQKELGWILIRLDRYVDSLKVLVKVLEVEEKSSRALPKNHPNVLLTKRYMAVAFSCLEQAEPAFLTMKQVVVGSIESLGQEHPETLIAERILASTVTKVDEEDKHYEEAEALFLDVLKAQKRIFGPNHYDVFLTKVNIINLYGLQERMVEACRLASSVVGDQEAVLGPDHPMTSHVKEFISEKCK